MNSEKIILSIIALLAGLLVAGAGFYFYQSTKAITPSDNKSISITPPTPTSSESAFLTISSPQDEEVVDKKVITVSGTTRKDAVILISSNTADEVVVPAQNGAFTTTIAIEDDQNKIEITAILPTGEEITEIRTVTYSTENF